MILFLVSVVSFLAGLLITALVRRYSLKYSIIDTPNARSSHAVPTPRGGGLSIAIALIVGILGLWLFDLISLIELVGIGIGILVIAITGWIDDHKHIPSIIRALIYLIASLWFVGWLGIEDLERVQYVGYLEFLSYILASLCLAWLINLYNFMDGIDALAATQAISYTLFGAMLFINLNETGLAILCLVLAFSCLGFLYWNWPPARIFMGDVGSCSIGFMLGVIAILALQRAGISIGVWLILLAVFILDATLTLCRRMLRGEKWYTAHKSHAYQRLIQLDYTHKQVVIMFIILNLLLLWPAAYYVVIQPKYSVPITLLIYSFLAVLWVIIQSRAKVMAR